MVFVGPTWRQRDGSVLVASLRFNGSKSRKTKGNLADTLQYLEEGIVASQDDSFQKNNIPNAHFMHTTMYKLYAHYVQTM